jgi:hypothetical protein
MHAFVPKAFRSFATDPIEEKYEQNLKRIREAQKKEGGPTEAPALESSMSLAAKFGDYDSKSEVGRASSSSDSKSQSMIPDFAQFVPEYKQFIPDYKQYIPTNVSQFDYDKFIPDYEKYMDIKKYQDFADEAAREHAPSNASKCTTLECLRAWRKAAESPIHAFVPKMYRSFSMDSIDEEYARNVLRIEAANEAKKKQGAGGATANSSRRLSESANKGAAHIGAADYDQYLPNYANYQDVQKYIRFARLMLDAKAPSSISRCKTKKELVAWRAKTEAPIKKYVPKQYQHFSLDSIEQQYSENLKRIEESQKASHQNKTKNGVAGAADQKGTESALAAVLMQLHVEDGFSLDARQFPLTRVNAPVNAPEVQDLVPSYAKQMDVEMFLSFASFIQQQQQQRAPEKVGECKNMNQLNAWYKKQNAIIKEFVPKAYQTFPAHALEKKYEEGKRRIEASHQATQKIETSPLQFASTGSYLSSSLVASTAVMFSVASIASLSWHLRRESALEERLLEPEAPCAA